MELNLTHELSLTHSIADPATCLQLTPQKAVGPNACSHYTCKCKMSFWYSSPPMKQNLFHSSLPATKIYSHQLWLFSFLIEYQEKQTNKQHTTNKNCNLENIVADSSEWQILSFKCLKFSSTPLQVIGLELLCVAAWILWSMLHWTLIPVA